LPGLGPSKNKKFDVPDALSRIKPNVIGLASPAGLSVP